MYALKRRNFRGVLWRVKGLEFDLPSEQSLLDAPDLCSFPSSCSQGVMIWKQQAQKAGPPSGCQGTHKPFYACPFGYLSGETEHFPSWLSLPLVSSEWNSYGIPKSWLSYYPPSSVEITLALRAVKLVFQNLSIVFVILHGQDVSWCGCT